MGETYTEDILFKCHIKSHLRDQDRLILSICPRGRKKKNVGQFQLRVRRKSAFILYFILNILQFFDQTNCCYVPYVLVSAQKHNVNVSICVLISVLYLVFIIFRQEHQFS